MRSEHGGTAIYKSVSMYRYNHKNYDNGVISPGSDRCYEMNHGRHHVIQISKARINTIQEKHRMRLLSSWSRFLSNRPRRPPAPSTSSSTRASRLSAVIANHFHVSSSDGCSPACTRTAPRGRTSAPPASLGSSASRRTGRWRRRLCFAL